MLAPLDLRGVPDAELASRLPRPAADPADANLVAGVRAVLDDVRRRGDAAVRDATERFDGVRLDSLSVPQTEWNAARAALDPAVGAALEEAAAAIAEYHRAQIPSGDILVVRDGVAVWGLRRPVDRAGCYVPSAAAPLLSTVLMTAVPARVAGVPEVVVCTAPGPDGRVAPGILAAAAVAGVDELYRIGGVQAIAALAYGTESVRPVDVLVGPGSARVAQAKREVAGEGRVGVPSAFTGPSEVVVVADDSVPPVWAAVDVVVQAEHGPGGLSWLLTWSEDVAAAVVAEVERLVVAAPRRAEIESTLRHGGHVALVDGPEHAVAVANRIAPEHLELLCDDAEALLPLVRHAGAVFCGPLSPASVGDYVAGPSHVLPTFGSARFGQALTVDDFVKHVHAVTVDKAGFDRVAPHVIALAEAEGLAAHADSIRLRQGGLT